MHLVARLPKVTILIPSKNNQDTIGSCLQSLLNLEYPQSYLELIVVDSSLPQLKLNPELGNRVRLIHANCSAPAAYNLALPYATGDVIAFIDADALADRLWLRKLIESLLETDAAGVGGNIKTGNRNNSLSRSIGYELERRYTSMPTKILRISTSNLAVWRRILVEVGGIDESLPTGYDARLGQDIRSHGHYILFNPAAIVYHFHRSSFRAYFKQQFRYALYDVRLYTTGFPIGEDTVTTRYMIADLALWAIGLALGLAALVLLLVDERDPHAVLVYPAMLIVRAYAWSLGGLIGLLSKRRRESNGKSSS